VRQEKFNAECFKAIQGAMGSKILKAGTDDDKVCTEKQAPWKPFWNPERVMLVELLTDGGVDCAIKGAGILIAEVPLEVVKSSVDFWLVGGDDEPFDEVVLNRGDFAALWQSS
jgi:hypothetical protein